MSNLVVNRAIKRLQGYRCYLCGHHFRTYPAGTPDRRRLNRNGKATLDHVRPRAKGHKRAGNKLFAHADCNCQKADREPKPCELIYLDAINLRLGEMILQGLSGGGHKPSALGAQAKPKHRETLHNSTPHSADTNLRKEA